MKHRAPLLILLLTILIGGIADFANGFTHPGILNNTAELAYMAAQVNANVQPWLDRYNTLESYTAYTTASDASIDMQVGSAEYHDWPRDCEAAYGSALQWVVSGIAARRDKAIEILNALANTVTTATGNDLRLRISWHATDCLNAAEILRHYGASGWSAGQQTTFRNWVNSFIVPRLALTDLSVNQGQSTGNWSFFGARSRMAAGVFLDDQALYDQGLSEIQGNLRVRIGTPSWCAGCPSSFYSELCRSGNTTPTMAGGDTAHSQMAMLAAIDAAEIAKKQGETGTRNLYTYTDPADGAGIVALLDYMDQWIGYDMTPPRAGAVNTNWPCQTSLANVDTSPFSVWRMAYNHYGTAAYDAVADYDESLSDFGCNENDQCFPALTHRYNEGSGPPADTTNPTTPGSPAATVNSSSQITVSWTASTDNVGVTQYRIDHCDGTCTPSLQLVLVSGTTLAYAHVGLGASSTHSYRIRALDAAGNASGQTATVTATTLAAVPTPIIGPTVWVSSPDGNDSNPGTQAQPYLTFRRGLSQTGPGETLYARGTHDPAPGLAPGAGLPPGTSFVFVPLSGTSWNAPVTVRNWPGSTLTLQHPNSSGCLLDINSNAKYFQMIGEPVPFGTPKRIQMNRCGIGSSVSGAGNEMSGGGEYVIEHVEIFGGSTTEAIGAIFRNVRLSHIRCHDNGQTTNDHCVYTHPDNVILEGFECYNQTGYCMQIQNTREQQGLTCPAPNYCGVNNITVRNNVIRNNGGGGVIVRGSTGPGGSQIYNNFIYNNFGPRGILMSNGPNALVAHNTVSGNNIGLSTITTSNCQVILNGNPQVINNLVVNSATNRPGFCNNNVAITSTNLPSTFHNNYFGNGVNPLFANAAAGDFRLLAGSPAINTGLTLAGVPRDYFGATRPAGPSYDIGAHEFGGVITPPPGDSTPPTTPTLLTLTLISPTQVNLDWADSTDNVAVTGYRVYRCSHTGGGCVPSVVIASPAVSNYADTGLVPATQYVFAVAAFDAAGNLSQLSSTAGITTTTPPADIIAPTVPTGLIATALAFDQIGLTWTASTDAVGVTGYLVRRCTPAPCTPSTQIDVTATTSYSSLGLTASTGYSYSVAARDAANNVSAYSTVASATTPAGSTTPSIILLLNNTTTNTGTAGGTPVATSITFTTTAAQLAEGTHAAVWNAAADLISVPLTGFTNPNNLTIATSFYADTAFATTWRMIFDHTTIPANANRVALYASSTGAMYLTLGNTNVQTNVLGTAIPINTLLGAVLRLTNGTYDLTIMQDGAGIIRQLQGTYTDLTTFGPNLFLGNNGTTNALGWRGSIDAFYAENTRWTNAQVDSYCSTHFSGCTAPPPPTYDPFLMASGVQGDGISSANNTTIAVTMTGTPNPIACADLTQFFLAYEAVREPITSCSLTGSLLQLSVASPPATPLTNVGLTYLPTAQQLVLTNNTVPDLTTGNNLQQVSWWCRRDVSDSTDWEQLPNQMCRVPSPGVINLRVDVVNIGGVASLAQAYALYCDTNLTDGLDAVRISEVSTAQPFPCESSLGICLNRESRGIADGTVRTPVLPNPSGVTAIAAGTLQRSDSAPISPVLAPQTRTEFEFSLRIPPGIPRGTIFHCGVRPASSGAPLSLTHLAPIRVDFARFFSE